MKLTTYIILGVTATAYCEGEYNASDLVQLQKSYLL